MQKKKTDDNNLKRTLHIHCSKACLGKVEETAGQEQGSHTKRSYTNKTMQHCGETMVNNIGLALSTYSLSTTEQSATRLVQTTTTRTCNRSHPFAVGKHFAEMVLEWRSIGKWQGEGSGQKCSKWSLATWPSDDGIARNLFQRRHSLDAKWRLGRQGVVGRLLILCISCRHRFQERGTCPTCHPRLCLCHRATVVNRCPSIARPLSHW